MKMHDLLTVHAGGPGSGPHPGGSSRDEVKRFENPHDPSNAGEPTSFTKTTQQMHNNLSKHGFKYTGERNGFLIYKHPARGNINISPGGKWVHRGNDIEEKGRDKGLTSLSVHLRNTK